MRADWRMQPQGWTTDTGLDNKRIARLKQDNKFQCTRRKSERTVQLS